MLMEPLGKIVIAGGSGFLGQSLARAVERNGGEVVVLSRHHDRKSVHWDARTQDSWTKHLEGASALVNLVGRTVDCIKTPEHCDEILRSRVEWKLRAK